MSPNTSMAIPTTRLGGRVRVLETWFDDWPQAVAGYDLVHYHQRSNPRASWNCLYYYTILIDIDLPPEALLAGMKNGNPQQIRRGLAKDGFQCHFHYPPSPAQIDEFHAFFDQWLGADMKPLDRGHVDMLASGGLLALSQARAADGTSLAWHAYIYHPGQERARCDLSATARADPGDSEQRNLCGRANRVLHFQDMLTLRERGIKCYDFGGWYPRDDDPKRTNINRFKEGFGGRVVREFDCTEVVSLRGRAYLALRWLKWSLFDKELINEQVRRRLRLKTVGPGSAAQEALPPDPASWELTIRCQGCRKRDPGACHACTKVH
jgi:hypothetical protein